MKEVVQRVRKIAMAKGEARMIATANAQFAQIARIDRRFHAVLEQAEIVVADGMSIVAASHLLGRPLPERIAGVDLVVEICREAANTGLSVYFLGGKPRTAEKTAERLKARLPGLVVAGIDCPPHGFEHHAHRSEATVGHILEAAPDILFVGLGAPRQEFWMKEHADALPVKVMIGVGCSFDVLSGDMPRAPRWMQKTGLEWFFRLCVEPKRLWRRYVFGNLQFLRSVLRQCLAKPACQLRTGVRW